MNESIKGATVVLIKYLVMAPGAIETDFACGRVRDNKAVNAGIGSDTVLVRTDFLNEIGDVMAFLCTEEARWIKGQRIEVSVGMNR